MPIVSGFVVPKMNPTRHVGNIRLLRPVVVTVEHQEDSQAENYESKDKEEPEEILHIVSEVGSIVFLVPLPNPFAFIIEHFIDFVNVILHLTCHPLVFLVEHYKQQNLMEYHFARLIIWRS